MAVTKEVDANEVVGGVPARTLLNQLNSDRNLEVKR